MLKVIEGEFKEDNRERLNSKLQMLVNHTRNLENSLAIINNLALTLQWEDLNEKVSSCRHDLLQLLKYIKDTHRQYVKSASKNPELSIAIDNTDQDVIEG